MISTAIKQPLIEKFWNRVDRGGDHECWNWKNQWFYVRDGVKPLRPSRISYEIHFGKIKVKTPVVRDCKNQRCVNPKHLYLGIINRKKSRGGRYENNKGFNNPRHKLNMDQLMAIKTIRKNQGLTYQEIGKRFNVSDTTVWRVVTGKSYINELVKLKKE